MAKLETRIGDLCLKNPVIAAPGEHLIDIEGVRAAIEAGAGAVVGKSINELQAARHQLQQAEYTLLDRDWNKVDWSEDAPRGLTVFTRSGLPSLTFDAWLLQAVSMDRLAGQHDCLFVPSLVLAQPAAALDMARAIQAAGLKLLELNIGTPYASQAARCAVSTELVPERVARLTGMMVEALDIPVWIKISGQSERVGDLAEAAFSAGAQSVVMAGRSLGLVPDLETQKPVLDTSCGIGGYWNLPITCHWLATSRRRLGPGCPLIGTNGATNGRDVARMMLAGSSAVGLSSEVMLRGWRVITDAVDELEAYCDKMGMSAADLIGRAADARRTYTELPTVGDHWRDFIPSTADAAPEG
ncbi:dihydroorotate dehydrogenase [Phaeobacter sp. A36a-5a]|uniref:dihydroorotate dehydrogenase n=1 Tax=Phaeobacter bryozoorum TaxID=1086632 RepID=UPI0035A680E6